MVDTNERHVARGRVEIRTGADRRRRWTAAQKGRIVAEAIRPGAVLAEVARRHELAPQHLSNWIRAAKDGHFALPADAAAPLQPGPSFVPVVTRAPELQAASGKRRASERGTIEIAIGRAVVRIRAGADPRMVEALVAALARAAL
jgi:transposase